LVLVCFDFCLVWFVLALGLVRFGVDLIHV
jgi:hypothetical protein